MDTQYIVSAGTLVWSTHQHFENRTPVISGGTTREHQVLLLKMAAPGTHDQLVQEGEEAVEDEPHSGRVLTRKTDDTYRS